VYVTNKMWHTIVHQKKKFSPQILVTF